MNTTLPEPQLRVAFRNFHPGFSPNEFWLPLISAATGRSPQLVPTRAADLVFTSVFEDLVGIWKRRLFSKKTTPALPSPPTRLKAGARSVWVSGENIRVPYCDYDLTLSFDLDPYDNSNLYWPYLFENLSWGFKLGTDSEPPLNARGVPMLTPESVAKPRDNPVSQRDGFVCAFIGNPEPVRMRAIDALKTVGDVHVFGSAVGRPVRSKFEIARNFRFSLSFENDVYPGYVTEKPLESYACGSIPLWRGLDAGQILNPRAMINALDFASLEEFARRVHTLDSNPAALDEMGSEALLRAQPTLISIGDRIRRLVTHI